jgi:hypothetical protein
MYRRVHRVAPSYPWRQRGLPQPMPPSEIGSYSLRSKTMVPSAQRRGLIRNSRCRVLCLGMSARTPRQYGQSSQSSRVGLIPRSWRPQFSQQSSWVRRLIINLRVADSVDNPALTAGPTQEGDARVMPDTECRKFKDLGAGIG